MKKKKNLMEYASGGEVIKFFPDDFDKLTVLASGGLVSGVPIEAEGQEVIETPAGSVGEIKGQSHEQGGVPMVAPEGSMIYSDRISIDGESLADRKKKRTNYLKRVGKVLEKNPLDAINKNTARRAAMTSMIEEQRDQEIQKIAAPYVDSGTNKMAGGGIVGGAVDTIGVETDAPSMNLSGVPWNQLMNGLIQIGTQLAEGSPNSVKNPLLEETEELRPYKSGGMVKKYAGGNKVKLPKYTDVGYLSGEIPQEDSTFDIYDWANKRYPITPDAVEMGIDTDPNRIDTSSANSLNELLTTRKNTLRTTPATIEEPNPLGHTIGNAVGTLGTAVGTIAPLINTLNNRRATRPNINAYLGFGKDALDTNSQEFDYIDNQKQAAQENLALANNSAKMRNRNSAGSINTQRALDTITDLGYNKATGELAANLSNLYMGSLGRREGLQNQADAYRMQGEQQRDIADRQDQDNFYSNLGSNLAGIGTGIQTLGSNLNKEQETEDIQALIGEMSKYGLGVSRGRNGRIKLTKTK